jgi:fatty acid desaturase
MIERSIRTYVRELRPVLPDRVFAPARSRLLWLFAHAAIIGTLAWLLASDMLPGWAWPLASLVIGFSLAGVTFLGHETLHGGVVRGKWLIRIVGWFGFLPFTVSPRLWMAWHNRVHHNHCTKPGVDPDMYPTLEEYHRDRGQRIMADYFGIGRRRLMGFLSILVGFTGQSSHMLFVARKRGILSAKHHREAIFETLLGVAFWATVAVLVGFVPFIFIYLIPLVVANSIVMLFIMTNHNLSPLTEVNDPLLNSLSVTLPRPLVWLTLGFGFHVEHHLFPTVSTRHGSTIRDAVLTKFADRYQSMSLPKAIKRLYQTARVYKDRHTLIDPPSGMTFPTLGPRTDPD